MDTQTPDFETAAPAPGISRIFIKRLLRKLAATLPIDAHEIPEEFAEEWEAARELFYSMQPRDPLEAALAARAVACHYRNMDMLARAAKPDVSDEKVLRLSATAAAAGRSFDAAVRMLEKRHKPAAEAAPKPTRQPARQPEPVPEPTPVTPVELFQPRDKYGKPIPDWRFEWMTMAQRRATYCYPRNPELEAEAIAEEEKMIAEQAALDAAQPAASPDAEQQSE